MARAPLGIVFRRSSRRLAALVALLACLPAGRAQIAGEVRSEGSIGVGAGGFGGSLSDGDFFGSGAAALGDLNGDGIADAAVGAFGDDTGSADAGGVWILFLDAAGGVVSQIKIANGLGGLPPGVLAGSGFGSSVANIGDLDGDGVTDLAVGAPLQDDGGADRGAVWILFLNTNGTVKAFASIVSGAAGLPVLHNGDAFGAGVAGLGDFDGDGVRDIAVGASGFDTPSTDSGRVWLIKLHADGTVKGFAIMLSGTLGDRVGSSVAAIGDVNADGVTDVAIGAPGDVDGRVYAVLLKPDGTPQLANKLDQLLMGLSANAGLGVSVAAAGDVNGDGTPDILAGAPNQVDLGGNPTGEIWTLFLRSDASPRGFLGVSNADGNLNAALAATDRFGASLAVLGDLDGDGRPTWLVGQANADTGGADRGRLLMLETQPKLIDFVTTETRIGAGSGGFAGTVQPGEDFGGTVALLGDLGGDGHPEIMNGPTIETNGKGGVWVLSLGTTGSVIGQRKISTLTGGFGGNVGGAGVFGTAVAGVGDLDGDGVPDAAVSSTTAQNIGGDFVWILLLNPLGTVKSWVQIGPGLSGFGGAPAAASQFAGSLAAIGDVDGDGVGDLAVGAPLDAGAGALRGAVWILFLNSDGTVKAWQRIAEGVGGLGGVLQDGAQFGSSMTGVGDLDHDGVPDLAVSNYATQSFTESNPPIGQVLVLFLNADGTVKAQHLIGEQTGNVFGSVDSYFVASLASLGDADGDGRITLAVGTTNDGNDNESGAVRLLDLQSDGTVTGWRKLTGVHGGLQQPVTKAMSFGVSVAAIGDLDTDGEADLAVGDRAYMAGQTAHVWTLLLNSESTQQWTNIGPGVPGTALVPRLTGHGTLLAATPARLDLASARPSSLAVLFVSLASTPAGFKGGLLYPFPPLITLSLGTNAQGAIPLPFTWPTGLPSATQLFFQWGVSDPLAVQAVALSNGLRAVTP